MLLKNLVCKLSNRPIAAGAGVTLAMVLMVGCNGHPDQERKDVTAGNITPGVALKVEAPMAAAPTLAPAVLAPVAAAPAAIATAPAAAGTPKECTEYKAIIEKLSTCSKMQEEVRTALRASFIKDSDNWGATEPSAMAAQASGCAQRAQQVKDMATTICGW